MQIANPLVGEALSNPGVVIWDTLTRLAILVTFAAVLRQLRVLLDQQTALARRDPLTGVLNRRAFFEEADRRSREAPAAPAAAYVSVLRPG